jgi:hypothetical protein
MTASAVPFVTLVICMFASFMGALGYVSISLALADRREARAKAASSVIAAAAFPDARQSLAA